MSLAAKRGELLASAAENANPRKWDFEHISLNFLAKSDERLIVNILLSVRVKDITAQAIKAKTNDKIGAIIYMKMLA